MSEAKHTPGQIEIVGATYLVIFGEQGGNICAVSSPRREVSVEYHAAKMGDDDFHEACANAQQLKLAWNSYAALYEACKRALAVLEGRCDDLKVEGEVDCGIRSQLHAALTSATPLEGAP